MAIVPVLILVALRVLIVPDHPGSLIRDAVGTMDYRFRHLADQPYMFTVGAWGVLFPLLLLFPRRIPGMVRRRPEDAFFVFFFAVSVLILGGVHFYFYRRLVAAPALQRILV